MKLGIYMEETILRSIKLKFLRSDVRFRRNPVSKIFRPILKGGFWNNHCTYRKKQNSFGNHIHRATYVPSFKKIRAVFLIVHFPLEKRVQKSYFLDLLSCMLEDSEFLHMNRNHDSEHIKTFFNPIGQGFRLEIDI